jgi:hypothetical protein
MKGITIRDVSPDFREGFNFAVRAIHDMYKDREGYTLENLDETLSSIIILIDKGFWWPNIKSVSSNE